MLGNSRKDWGKLSGLGDRFLKTRKEQTEPQLFSSLWLPNTAMCPMCSLVPSSVEQLACPPPSPFNTKWRQVSGPVPQSPFLGPLSWFKSHLSQSAVSGHRYIS